MVYDKYSDAETVIIEDQDFPRWDFKFTAVSEKVLIRNQKFRESSTLDLSARNQIVISENTVLKPNTNGRISLKIDPSLERECELVLRDPSIEE